MGRRRRDYGANDVRIIANEMRDTSRQIRGIADEVNMDAARHDTALGRAILRDFLDGRDIASIAPFRNALAASQAIQAREMRQQGLNAQRLATFGLNPYQVENANAMRRLMAEEMGARTFSEATAQSLPIVLSTASGMADRENQALAQRIGILGSALQGYGGATNAYGQFGTLRRAEIQDSRSPWRGILRAALLAAAPFTGGFSMAALGASMAGAAGALGSNRGGG